MPAIAMSRMRPRFSIIVPTRGRPQQLARCLEGVCRLLCDREDLEVIVVDDGSPASSRVSVEPYRDRVNIDVVAQPHSGPAVARNLGAARARGTYLAFLDDDCWPAPEWLEQLAEAFAAHAGREAIVGGRTENALSDNTFSEASELIVGYLVKTRLPDGTRFFPTNNLAVRSEAFRRIGGFSARYPMAGGEDREFCRRWQEHGHAAVDAPKAVVYHAHSLTLGSFLRQQFTYGRGAALFHGGSPGTPRGNGLPRLGAFHLNLLRFPFTRATPYAWRHLVLVLLSQVSVAAGFVQERSRRGSPVPERKAESARAEP